MKRNLFILFILITIGTNSIADSNSDSLAFNARKVILSIGYGYPNLDQWAFDNSYQFRNNETYKSIGFGPFHFRVEYGLSDKIGIGVSLNYNTYGGMWTGGYPTEWTGNFTPTLYAEKNYKKQLYSFTGLIRFNYHIFTTAKLDPYFAFGAGLKTIWKSYNSSAPKYINDYYNGFNREYGVFPFPAAFEAVAGMRYYVTKHFAIYSELGMAKSLIQAGMSIGF